MRTGLKQWLKGKSAETIISIAKNKIDMFEEGKRADKLMDEQLGPVSSERIQRGTLTILIIQFLKGLWAENPEALATYFKQESDTMFKNIEKGK